MQLIFLPFLFFSSACPEKIVEFEERRARKKKLNRPKAKPNKSRNMSHLDDYDDIHQKLQNLLLDAESGSNSVHCPLASRAVISENVILAREVNQAIRDPIPTVDIELESSTSYGASISSCHEVGQSASRCEIIDLLSPSPQIRHRTVVSKHKDGNVHCVDVINLSDS